MKIKNLIICLAFLTFGTSQAFGKASILAFDYSQSHPDGLPNKFRDLSVFRLNAIASAQFSEEELKKIRKKYPNEKIIIIDLRQESHGFINGKPVIWSSYYEKINQDKTIPEILMDEKLRLGSLARNKEIIVNEVIERDRESGWYKKISPQIIRVNKAVSEEELAKKYDFGYKRFSIRYFDKPEIDEFKRMVNFIKTLPKDQKIYVHCSVGSSRTGMFLVTYDIIKNGNNTSLQKIIKRQSELGAVKFDDMAMDEIWTEELARERYLILQDFYNNQTKKPAKKL